MHHIAFLNHRVAKRCFIFLEKGGREEGREEGRKEGGEEGGKEGGKERREEID